MNQDPRSLLQLRKDQIEPLLGGLSAHKIDDLIEWLRGKRNERWDEEIKEECENKYRMDISYD